MKKIGLTTTVPIEVLLAAGYQAIDLNNIFVTSEDYLAYIELAEQDGFPKSMCAWIKGIYGAVIQNDIKDIIGVKEGDCSNTKVLLEILASKGVIIHPFSFNHQHDVAILRQEINAFQAHFGVDSQQCELKRQELNVIRKKVRKIDELTYKEMKVTGFENHLLQLCMSDFDGDDKAYHELIDMKSDEIELRKEDPKTIRLGYIGVPPMIGDLFDFVESLDSRFIYNEVQREFAFPRCDGAADLAEMYHDYTYPYDFNFRMVRLKQAIEERQIDGIVHYTQAFCHKATEHILLKDQLNIPLINIEGDKANQLDARTKIRLEAFIDMIKDRKGL